MIENKPFKRQALAYVAIEQILREAKVPLSIYDIERDSRLAGHITSSSTVYDMLKTIRSKGYVRKVPASVPGKNTMWAYEWITKPVSTLKQPVEGKLNTKCEKQPTVPEIIVSSHNVVIITNKIKITVEY